VRIPDGYAKEKCINEPFSTKHLDDVILFPNFGASFIKLISQ